MHQKNSSKGITLHGHCRGKLPVVGHEGFDGEVVVVCLDAMHAPGCSCTRTATGLITERCWEMSFFRRNRPACHTQRVMAKAWPTYRRHSSTQLISTQQMLVVVGGCDFCHDLQLCLATLPQLATTKLWDLGALKNHWSNMWLDTTSYLVKQSS